MNLPYKYELMIRVEIMGDGMHADGDGAVATARRLAKLLETDDHVVKVSHWPDINYLRRHKEST